MPCYSNGRDGGLCARGVLLADSPLGHTLRASCLIGGLLLLASLGPPASLRRASLVQAMTACPGVRQ